VQWHKHQFLNCFYLTSSISNSIIFVLQTINKPLNNKKEYKISLAKNMPKNRLGPTGYRYRTGIANPRAFDLEIAVRVSALSCCIVPVVAF